MGFAMTRRGDEDVKLGSRQWLRNVVALVNSASDLPPVGKPSLTIRKSRILGRYVFRDELRPGESLKRRIEGRRERRA